jgi:hypothetical protein
MGDIEAFDPSRPSVSPSDSILLPIGKVPGYLDAALKALALHTEARTSFITYAPSLCISLPKIPLRESLSCISFYRCMGWQVLASGFAQIRIHCAAFPLAGVVRTSGADAHLARAGRRHPRLHALPRRRAERPGPLGTGGRTRDRCGGRLRDILGAGRRRRLGARVQSRFVSRFGVGRDGGQVTLVHASCESLQVCGFLHFFLICVGNTTWMISGCCH